MNSGIYSITNKINGKTYWGSTDNLKRRLYHHRYYLNKNTHYNSHLQRSWNKYGESNFIFEVIETIPKKDLLIVEQQYLDLCKLMPTCFYNVTYTAEAFNTGVKHTDEAKRKVSIANKGRLKGISQTKEHLDKRVAPLFDKNIYTFHNKRSNEIFNGTRVDFYTKYNLSKSKVCQVLNGSRPHHKGWILWQEQKVQ